MKSFWMGLVGSCVGMALFVTVGIVFGQDIFQVEKDGTPRFRVTADGKIPVGSTGSYENLVIQNSSGEPNNKVDITANVITVEGVRLESLSVTATVTTSGAGGLDTGSEVGSTWYYVWTITNNDGSTVNGLLSTSSSSPTLPSGYTKKRRLGAVRNDGSSNFLLFVQEGNKCNYINPLTANRIVSDGVATTFTSVSAAAFIPSTSQRGIFGILSNVNHNAASTSFTVRARKAGSGGNDGQAYCANLTAVANISSTQNAIGETDTDGSQQIDYKIAAVPSGGGGAYIDVFGYYDRI